MKYSKKDKLSKPSRGLHDGGSEAFAEAVENLCGNLAGIDIRKIVDNSIEKSTHKCPKENSTAI